MSISGSLSAVGAVLGTATMVPLESVLTLLFFASSFASSSMFNSGSSSAVGAVLGTAMIVPSGNVAMTLSFAFSSKSLSLSNLS